MLDVVGVVVKSLIADRWLQGSPLGPKARDAFDLIHRHLQVLKCWMRAFETFQYPMEREFGCLKFLRSNRFQAVTSSWRL